MGLCLRERGGKEGRATCCNGCDILDSGLEKKGFHFKGQHSRCEKKNSLCQILMRLVYPVGEVRPILD